MGQQTCSLWTVQTDLPACEVADTMTWIFLFAALGLTTATASAQTTNANPWNRGTTLTISGGAATASPNTTGVLGTALGWELTHRAEVEGAAAWLSRHDGADAFTADLKLLVNLTRPTRAVPYIGGGIGLYRGTFATGLSNMPAFYRRRTVDDARMARTSYTDPAGVIAAGMNLYVARHVSIRPEIGMRVVTNDNHTYRVGTVTVGLVYHVEEHAASMKMPE